MRDVIAAVVALGMLAAAAPANAGWHKAETDLFVVYGDVREDTLRDYAVKLTNFDHVLRMYAPPPKDAPPLRKLDVYLLRDHDELRQIQPRLPEGIVGFYMATPRALFAAGVAAPLGMTSKDEVLFHEYAHHFMLENFPAPYPTWFIEGWADYFATTKFTPTGFQVGAYDEGRVAMLFRDDWLPLSDLLSKSPGQTKNGFQFYSQAWLLTHYMYDDSARAAELNKATLAIAHGADPVKAIEEATGLTLPQLTGKLRAYRQIHIASWGGRPPGPEPAVTMSEVPDAIGDFLLDRLRVAMADAAKPDAGYLRELRGRAKKVPDSEFAQLTLASAEYVYGDPKAGDEIAGRYAAARADDEDALAVAGVGNVIAGERFPDRRAAFFQQARGPLIKAYALDKDDYRVLFAYATSRAIEPAYPNANDVNALLEARELARSVQEISLVAGAALMKRGQAEQARPILAAVANNPHANRLARAAKAVMDGKTLDEALAEKPKDAKAGAAPATPES
jgi:hypothetical protein